MPNSDPFDSVPCGLAEALRRRGFTELTAVQKAVIAADCEGRDLRLSSKTGSGKTVALGLALARDLGSESSATGPRGLVIAPTRELAAQLYRELEWLFADLNLPMAVMTGGVDIRRDFRALKDQPAVIVGTPGRLCDHLKRGSLDLSAVATVILDEADEMLDMGFKDELETLLSGMAADRRTHLVSATFPRKVKYLADQHQTAAFTVQGTPVGMANADITHQVYVVDAGQRFALLRNVLLASGADRTLCFARTRVDTTALASALSELGFRAAALNGDMNQRERTATLSAFRAGTVSVLVATDVAARGLDVAGVDMVLHYDMAENDEAFTHRSGRTGRAGATGQSVLFATTRQRNWVDGMFGRLGIKPKFAELPQPADVSRAAEQRLVAETMELAPAELDHRELAIRLLEAADPITLVQALLSRSDSLGPCEPVTVEPPRFRKGKGKGKAANGSYGGAKSFGNGKGPSTGRSHGHQGARRSGDFTPFHVNWGAKAGANPSRLLAMVCRRGNLKSSRVGAIRIAPHSAVVEVASDIAASFEKAAGQPDSRNPKVRIRRFDERRQNRS